MDALGDPTRRSILERLRGGAKAVGRARGRPPGEPACRLAAPAGARGGGTRRRPQAGDAAALPARSGRARRAAHGPGLVLDGRARRLRGGGAGGGETDDGGDGDPRGSEGGARRSSRSSGRSSCFTARIGSWWPTLTHSIHEADAGRARLGGARGRARLRGVDERRGGGLGGRARVGAAEPVRARVARQPRAAPDRGRGAVRRGRRDHPRRARAPRLADGDGPRRVRRLRQGLGRRPRQVRGGRRDANYRQ